MEAAGDRKAAAVGEELRRLWKIASRKLLQPIRILKKGKQGLSLAVCSRGGDMLPLMGSEKSTLRNF